MLKRLIASAADFSADLTAALDTRRVSEGDVSQVVSDIIASIKADGDRALLDYTSRFDQVDYSEVTMRVSPEELALAEAACPEPVKDALRLAAERIHTFHANQRPKDSDAVDALGVRLGMRWSAIDAVGLYVPGGTASYPSSVLMNAIPAKAAGVKRLVMVAPTPRGALNPAVLYAATIAGVDEIYKIGGAQAVAALAFGTATITPIDKIVGPGNAYVAEAKRQVFGVVGIDTIAGPSEILVIADDSANPQWVAADLLSQAEHDRDAQSILITDSASLADAVDAEVQAMLAQLPRHDIAQHSITTHGLTILVNNIAEAAAIADRIAAEHLELMVAKPEPLLNAITHAGAIFIGHHTPEAIGDYIAGPSHVLPTTGAARFSSGLSVYDFIKKTSLIGCSAEAFTSLAEATRTLAEAEGLHAHALSVTVRSNR